MGVSYRGELATVGPLGYANAFSRNGRFLGYIVDEGAEGARLYLYDAATGETACASCAPPGNPNVGRADSSPRARAPRVPPLPTPVTDNGYVFFDTATRSLVPKDVNGLTDVYSFRARRRDADQPRQRQLRSTGSATSAPTAATSSSPPPSRW